jgi:hypothetical protein
MNGLQLSQEEIRNVLINNPIADIVYVSKVSLSDLYNEVLIYEDDKDEKSYRIYELESSEREIKRLIKKFLNNIDLKDDRLKEFRLDLETFIFNVKAEVGL